MINIFLSKINWLNDGTDNNSSFQERQEHTVSVQDMTKLQAHDQNLQAEQSDRTGGGSMKDALHA
jgi:hypothetical protein